MEEELDAILSQFNEHEFTSLLLDGNGLELRPHPFKLPFADEHELALPHHNEPDLSSSVSGNTTSHFSLTDDGQLHCCQRKRRFQKYSEEYSVVC